MSITPLHISESAHDDEPRLVPDDQTPNPAPELVHGFRVMGRIVNWEHTPSFADVAALLDPSEEVTPGQFVGVLHGRSVRALTIAQVGNAFEVNPNESPELSAARAVLGLTPSYGREGVSTRIYRLAQCATVEEFDLDTSWRITGSGRAPQLLARAGDYVVGLPPDVVMSTIGGLPSPSQGLDLGATAGPHGVPFVMTPTALQFGTLVVGNPSMGKSYLTGNIMEEARAWDIPAFVIDVNGEFIRAARELGGEVITLPDRDKFGLALRHLTARELVEITPNVQDGTIYAELIEIAHDRLKGEARGNAITFDQLRAKISEIGTDTGAAKGSIGAALTRISALEKDPLVGRDYDFVAQLEQKGLIVLDCRFLTLHQTRIIAAMAARELQRIGRERARAAEGAGEKAAQAAKWFSLLFIDEAHIVIPDDEKAVSTQVLFELARMGRHVRTGLVLSSQSPADINGSVLKRLQSRFVFALERDQLRSISGILADLDEKILAQLPKLPRGTCAVSGSSDVVRHGFLLNVRQRRTFAGGATPKVFEGRSKNTLKVT
jgi:uncharacterized protein